MTENILDKRYPCEYTKKIACSNYVATVSIRANTETEILNILESIRKGEWI